MAYGDKYAVNGYVTDHPGPDVPDACAGDARGLLVAQHVFERGVPDHFDLGILEQAVLQDLLGAEVVAPMDDGDLGGEVRQEQRLLDGRVAAADDHDFAATVEEAVAGGAGGDAKTPELLLARKVQPLGLRAG